MKSEQHRKFIVGPEGDTEVRPLEGLEREIAVLEDQIRKAEGLIPIWKEMGKPTDDAEKLVEERKQKVLELKQKLNQER